MSDSSNVDAVYERLRAAILNNELPAGARLSQVQLAAEFDMSRGPLREALRLLERDRLIEARHNRMVRVAPVSMTDLDQLYAMRILNESFAVRLTVPTLVAQDAKILEEQLAALDRHMERDETAALDATHRQFHMHLYKGAEDRLQQAIAEMFDHAHRYRCIYRQEESQYRTLATLEHRAIVEAAIAGEAAQAADLLVRHLARTALTLFATSAPEHEPRLLREAIRVATASDAAAQPLTG